jgi:hypothetical protein
MPIDHERLSRLFWVLLVLTLTTMAVLTAMSVPLGGSGAVVKFELCGFARGPHGDTCANILATWDACARRMAVRSLYLDFLFLTLYPSLICVALLLVSARVRPSLRAPTRWLAWLVPVAGLLDIGENVFLLKLLAHPSDGGYGCVASTFAATKFAIVVISLLWLVVAWIGALLVPKGAETGEPR